MLSGQQDYYSLLGILRDASAEEIRRAYLAAARRLHPDKNVLAGETELFLGIQQAYEVLSNPRRRALYDATLPPGWSAPAPVQCTMEYSRPNLVHLDESQLLYTLLTVAPSDLHEGVPATPLNICLVLDRSTSMQGEKMDVAKAAAGRILRMLRPEDLFGLVVFGDRAEVMLPSSLQRDLNSALSRVQAIQAGGATEIFHGLEAGLAEVRRGLDPNRTNHLILLTDGHTYGDEQACLELAQVAARLRISISGFGIGADWNDIFLDRLTAQTGGNSTYISDPKDIQELLVQKFKTLAKILVEDAILQFASRQGVQLRYAFRLQPEGGPIDLGDVLHLGPVLQDTALNVLFEFVVAPSASKADVVTLLDGTLQADVASRPIPFPPIPLRMERPSASGASPQVPPQSIVNALSRLALYRLQEQARQEARAGEFEAATRHLENLAVQLQAQGHDGLARTALLEAEILRKEQSLSPTGGKQIKYGTRALLLPAADTPEQKRIQ
jgi:Ca-activated chloride channel family protein